jgi:hypothetical protein
LLLEIFYQGGLLKVLKDNGVVSEKDLGTITGRIINGKTMRYMHIVDKAIVEKDKMKESQNVSDLMEDFPPISKEENPELLAAYVVTRFEKTGEIINLSSIPETTGGVPLKIAIKKRKSKKAALEAVEESEPKPKKQKNPKKAPELNVIKPTLPAIQEEIVDLEPE